MMSYMLSGPQGEEMAKARQETFAWLAKESLSTLFGGKMWREIQILLPSLFQLPSSNNHDRTGESRAPPSFQWLFHREKWSKVSILYRYVMMM
jgi:hypothetical protein